MSVRVKSPRTNLNNVRVCPGLSEWLIAGSNGGQRTASPLDVLLQNISVRAFCDLVWLDGHKNGHIKMIIAPSPGSTRPPSPREKPPSKGVNLLKRLILFFFAFKQLPCRNFQSLGQLLQHDHRRIPRSPFHTADIGPMQAGAEGKLLL